MNEQNQKRNKERRLAQNAANQVKDNTVATKPNVIADTSKVATPESGSLQQIPKNEKKIEKSSQLDRVDFVAALAETFKKKYKTN